jgi:hypothetical protein
MDNQKPKTIQLKLTSLWKNKTADGKEFLTGRLGNLNISIWNNNYKKEDKHPDMIMYVSEPPPKKEDQMPAAKRSGFDF